MTQNDPPAPLRDTPPLAPSPPNEASSPGEASSPDEASSSSSPGEASSSSSPGEASSSSSPDEASSPREASSPDEASSPRDERAAGAHASAPQPPCPPVEPQAKASAESAAVGGARVEQAGAEGPAKKERVLHTRVPAVLERELKRFAENLRIPVSNLVRAILEDAVSVADAATEGVETRLRRAAQQLESERERLKRCVKVDPLADVIAFQAVTLAQAATCAKCGCDLAAGEGAHLGLVDSTVSGSRLFVCARCLPRP